jgi:hypothetical protein
MAKLYSLTGKHLRVKRQELKDHLKRAVGLYPELRRRTAGLQRSIECAERRRGELLVGILMY